MTEACLERVPFVDAARGAFSGLPGRGVPFLERLREQGLALYSDRGFPSPAQESFRFTPLDVIRKTEFALPQDAGARQAPFAALAEFDSYRLSFVDGRYVPDLSRPLPKGVLAGSLAGLLKVEPKRLEPYLGRCGVSTALSGLNAALFADGAVLLLPRGVVLDKPLHIVFSSSGGARPTMSHQRLLVVAESGASALIVEERFGPDDSPYWTNSRAEVLVGENAFVTLIALQREGLSACHTAALDVRLERSGRFIGHAISLGAALSRQDTRVKLDGEGADCELGGLYVVSGRQHVDHHTVVEHHEPHGTSRELYKGVLDGSARAVFNGLIDVRPKAQKTDAHVYNKNLLLSRDGLVNTNPEFRINANDVQCRHGATIGQLSQDALFYLRSRGLDQAEARALLVYAFASEMIERLPVEPLREALGELLRRKLGERA